MSWPPAGANCAHRPGRRHSSRCYDRDGQTTWKAFAPKLWARTVDALTRALRRLAARHGVHVRLRYAKVAEFQARGVVHLHAIFRLDGHNPQDLQAQDLSIALGVHLDRDQRVHVDRAPASLTLSTSASAARNV